MHFIVRVCGFGRGYTDFLQCAARCGPGEAPRLVMGAARGGELPCVKRHSAEQPRLCKKGWVWASCRSLLYGFFPLQKEQIRRKKREERLQQLRHNTQLKYAAKREVSQAWGGCLGPRGVGPLGEWPGLQVPLTDPRSLSPYDPVDGNLS